MESKSCKLYIYDNLTCITSYKPFPLFAETNIYITLKILGQIVRHLKSFNKVDSRKMQKQDLEFKMSPKSFYSSIP